MTMTKKKQENGVIRHEGTRGTQASIRIMHPTSFSHHEKQNERDAVNDDGRRPPLSHLRVRNGAAAQRPIRYPRESWSGERSGSVSHRTIYDDDDDDDDNY